MSSDPNHLIAGRYRLLEPLGQGGMGRVWKARDEVLHRDVAIKELVPPPGLTDDERREMRERSLREARAIARLNHVNVVRVFDVLRTDADPWIVMEYVPSRSLQEVLDKDGPLPPKRVAEIGLGVLAALRAAHQAGVVHRDVKPGNVLLEFPQVGAEGQSGRVVLTDFGLATVPGDPNVTRTGLVLGSPAYIAPERALDGSIAPAGDLWSLGATLYAAVEGQSPYARSSAMATLAALATEPLPSPRKAGPLKSVLAGLLRKDPASRINASEAERLLRRAFDDRPRRSGLLSGVRRAAGPAAVRAGRDRGLSAPRPPVTAPSPASTPELGRAPSSTKSDNKGPFLAWGVGLAALVLLTLVVVVPRLGSEPEGDRVAPQGSGATGSASAAPTVGGTSAAAPTPTVTPDATATTSAPPRSGQPGLPAGWRVHRDPTGFTVPVPVGWLVSREKYGPAPDEVRVYFKDPKGGRLLLIDQTNSPKADPVADWKQQEAARRGGYSGYRRVKIEAVDYWDKAADWEWTYNLNGTRVQVRNRGFITARDKAYGMFWRTPESVWAENLDAFEVIAAGFQPRPSPSRNPA